MWTVKVIKILCRPGLVVQDFGAGYLAKTKDMYMNGCGMNQDQRENHSIQSLSGKKELFHKKSIGTQRKKKQMINEIDLNEIQNKTSQTAAEARRLFEKVTFSLDIFREL